MQFGEMPHFFNTPHAFKKNGETQPGEMQFGEMPHTQINIHIIICDIYEKIKYFKYLLNYFAQKKTG